MKALNPILLSGQEVLPLIEGGKGVSVSDGRSSGAWAAAGGVGTFSGVNADSFDEEGNRVPYVYKGATRNDRHQELIRFGIDGALAQARIAHEMAGGNGRIHMNVLWEMGGTIEITTEVFKQAQGIIHGVSCGAGMPYKIGEIAASFGVYYYPIVSSDRAFRALWRRAYHKYAEWLGGVVYEDPWRAGGHIGLSRSEEPDRPEDPYKRVLDLRKEMRSVGLDSLPIVMAGGVWWLEEWEDWIDNPELGPIVFQFGTRPLLTQESPISDSWKKRLAQLKKGDVVLNRFSPTGFYSSAVMNPFLEELGQRSERQVAYSSQATETLDAGLPLGPRQRLVFMTAEDKKRAEGWVAAGYREGLKTPDDTLIFVEPEKAEEILADQTDCMGCLSACNFSNWSQNEEGTTGRRADPRSFCIQKSLQAIGHGEDIDQHLMFAGSNVHRFGTDPFYADGFVPTVKQLVDQVKTGR